MFKKIALTFALTAFFAGPALAGPVTKGDVQRLSLDQLTLGTHTLTAAELNTLDAVTPGTVAASSAVVVDSSKNIGTFGTIGAAGKMTNTVASSANPGANDDAFLAAITIPADSSGTNSHRGFRVTPTVGNATAGTNRLDGFKFDTYTGDAQVDVSAFKAGNSDGLGTAYGYDCGTGWDACISISSPILNTWAPTADGGVTDYGSKLAITQPVDTTGTNIHYGFEIAPTVSNATGGTNTFNLLQIDNVTGDAQVNVTGLNIGTGTVLGTSFGEKIGSGWDENIDLTIAPAIDNGQTVAGVAQTVTMPANTTGTNTINGSSLSLTVNNATGGTNTINGWNFANYTGDAQVNVNAINIGTSDGLGTANGISIGSGWTNGITMASPFNTTSTITGGSSSNIAINTNKFTVTASSGNTVIGGSLTVNGGFIGPTPVACGGTCTLGAANQNTYTRLDTAAGSVATLPAATGSGNVYRLYVSVANSSNADKILTNPTSDTIIGTAQGENAATAKIFVGNAGTYHSIQMPFAGTQPSGGFIGDTIVCTDVASTIWKCDMQYQAGTTPTTPYSASTS